jgi:glyoxylase I family protein
MPGLIDHLMINANSYDAAVRFYSWLMPKIGYPEIMSFEKPDRMTGFVGKGGSFWVLPSSDSRQKFDKRAVGLREIAFRAESRHRVNELAIEVSSQGGRILDPPREYNYRPGYYSVFFTDPDGLKLEVVHYTE